MKKISILLLALCMLFAFVACGGEKTTPTDAEVTEGTTEPATTERQKPEPVVIIEDEHLTLTVNDAYSDEESGYVIKTVVENKSETQYCYSIDSCSVNGVSVDAMFFAEVGPGKKAVEKIEFDDTYLKAMGIGDYTDIELEISVQKDVLEEPVATKTANYYPQGKDKAVKFERQAQATDKVLVDNEYVSITAVGTRHDEDYEATELLLYIVNKCDKDISVDARSVSVNDIMIEPYYSETVAAGKVRCSAVLFDDYELEEKEIEKIEKIEMEISGYGEMDYLEIFEKIDLEDIFGEDSKFDELFDGISLFKDKVVYEQ